MSEIDWSKAPEGATHYSPSNKMYYRVRGGKIDVYLFSRSDWDSASGSHLGAYGGELIEIPAPQWNGEGLPPVGAAVEWFSPVYGWLGGRVVGHDGIVSVISHNDGYTGCHLHEVRPIRTTEQLAAEAREKAVGWMLVDALGKGAGSDSRDTYMMQRLYDAGYRKQEPKP